MHITDTKHFPAYDQAIGHQIPSLIAQYDFSESNVNLGYRTQASAVYSSNIEGNSVDLNSFMNYKLSNQKFKSHKEIEEIENLVSAYEFAQTSPLSEKNLLAAHKILSKKLLTKSRQGKYRNDKVGVFSQAGLVYLAIEPEFVGEAMKELFEDISTLLKTPLTAAQAFYHASLIHLKFVHIHPFFDGNGRTTRLLEKWFLAEKLGPDFWKIQSEKFYKDHQQVYYNNLNLGVNYYALNYDKCLPFLEMLPKCLFPS